LAPPELDLDANVSFENAEKIAACTNRLLACHVRYCYEHSGFYRHKFDNLGIKVDDIHDINDLRHLPFTKKEDIAEHNNEMLRDRKSVV
jgi:phenylacetate-coenzyme A ligase PaaK-like adenylate-forming protein